MDSTLEKVHVDRVGLGTLSLGALRETAPFVVETSVLSRQRAYDRLIWSYQNAVHDEPEAFQGQATLVPSQFAQDKLWEWAGFMQDLGVLRHSTEIFVTEGGVVGTTFERGEARYTLFIYPDLSVRTTIRCPRVGKVIFNRMLTERDAVRPANHQKEFDC